MIVIETINGRKFWTEKYNDQDGFLKFDIVTKDGKTQNYELNRSQIVTIANVGDVDNINRI